MLYFYLQHNHVNLLHIESRPSKKITDHYEFMVECDPGSGDLDSLSKEMRECCEYMQIISRNYEDNQKKLEGEFLFTISLNSFSRMCVLCLDFQSWKKFTLLGFVWVYKGNSTQFLKEPHQRWVWGSVPPPPILMPPNLTFESAN